MLERIISGNSSGKDDPLYGSSNLNEDEGEGA